MLPEGVVVQLVIEDADTSLDGRLTEIQDGSGVSFAQISAVRIDSQDARTHTLATTRTEQDGSFVLSGLPADDGTLQLKVICPAGQWAPIYVPFGSTPAVACDAP